MSDNDYEVGYGKPPKAHQFKKGQSGNPNGRRKAATFDKLEIITAIYGEKVALTINGKRRRVSQFEAAVRMTLHKAQTTGDIRAFEKVMKLIEDQGGNWRERWAEEAKRGSEDVMEKISRMVDKMIPLPVREKIAAVTNDDYLE